MTTRTNGHQDQASSKTSAADGGAPDDGSRDRTASSASSGPIEPGESDRRRSRDGLAIGAPLTAAFIGGFLVIENLADADQPEEGAGANASEQALLLDGENAEHADGLSVRGRAAGAPLEGEEAAAGRAADPGAAPNEDAAIAAEDIGAGPATPVIAAVAAGTPVPDELEGGAEANLNQFNINIGNGEVQAGAEPFIEDDILSRDKQLGTPGDDVLVGTDGDDALSGGSGDDILRGQGGSDLLNGNEGNDQITAGAGDDVIEGGLGQDMLYGEAGDDVYVIGLNDSAVDTVFDHEGANRLTLEGVTDQTVEASLLGNDLYVTVDQAPVVIVSGYVGHENALAGIDFGQGLRPIETLLTDHPDLEAALDQTETEASEAAADDLLAAHLHLTEPTVIGDPRTNQRLDGAEGDDWLSGFDGKDILFGEDGNDILDGADGVDRLVGSSGDDCYLFSKGERGIDKIDDTEGRNLAELKGYDRADIEGAMLGDDLAVLADGEILITVDDFAANQGAFHGVQAGNRFIQTDELLA